MLKKNNFRIGIFWEQFEWGGVDTHLKNLLEHWSNNKDKIIIYHNSNNKGAWRLKKQLKNKVKSLYFHEFNSLFSNRKNYFNFLLEPIKFFFSVQKYQEFLKKDNLDFIICENGGYPASYGVCAALLSSFKINIPVRIFRIHHSVSKQKIIKKPFLYYLDKTLAKASSCIMFGSYANKNSVKKYSSLLNDRNTSSKVIYYCVPNYRKKNLKKILKKEKKIKLLGILGRIEEYKGHEDLIVAFSKLPNSIKNKNKIIIIGTGKEVFIKKLKKLIQTLNLEKNIIFTGFLEHNIENVICSLDLVVMATRNYEGFGYTVAEAMSVGTPVLASNVGAIKELLSKEDGRLFTPKNSEDLLKNLIDFNKNYSDWKKRARVAKTNINKKFDAKKIAKQFREYLIREFKKTNF